MRYNDTAVHSVPVGINILGSILHMSALKKQKKAPYPLESTILAFPDVKPQWTFNIVVLWSFLLIGKAFGTILGDLGVLIVAERQVRIKKWMKVLVCLALCDKAVFEWLSSDKTKAILSANQNKDKYHKYSLDFKVKTFNASVNHKKIQQTIGKLVLQVILVLHLISEKVTTVF